MRLIFSFGSFQVVMSLVSLLEMLVEDWHAVRSV
jgi:hypothetical protein